MKKINNIFLQQFYESYSFLVTKNLTDSQGIIYSKINKWFLLDNYLYIKNLKQILILINKLINENKKKNKVLFILDDDIYFFFEKSFINSHFLTNNIKIGLEFLQRSPYSSQVACVIHIGQINVISKNLLRQLNIPFFCFASKSRFNSDYFSYNMLSFHGSILYLKLIFKTILLKNHI